MKKIVAVIFTILMVISLSGCGKKPAAAPVIASDQSTASDKAVSGESISDESTPRETISREAVLSQEMENSALDRLKPDSEDTPVCYLPVRITQATDIPEQAEEQLGTGSSEKTLAVYSYDEAGRIIRYETETLTLSFQYLEEIALPAVLQLEDGTAISFTEPRWAQDAPAILLDVVYGDEVLPADFRLTELRQDANGKLTAARITWESQLGEQFYDAGGYTFDDKGNLLFVPMAYDGLIEAYEYQYGADGQVVGFTYGESSEGEFSPFKTVLVDEEGHPLRIEGATGDQEVYTDMGAGRYRSEWNENWEELVFDRNGNLYQSVWYVDASGITYTDTIQYETMPVSQYIGTPIDYTNAYPVLHLKGQGYAASDAQAAGNLQLPVVSQLILGLW